MNKQLLKSIYMRSDLLKTDIKPSRFRSVQQHHLILRKFRSIRYVYDINDNQLYFLFVNVWCIS